MSGRQRMSSSSESSSESSANCYPISQDDDSIYSSESMTECPSLGYATTIGKGLQTLKSDDTFSDITLKVGDKSIKCHKVILCIFSGYFRSMFQSGMKESKQSEVTLEMLDPVAVEAVIDYMYTDDILVTENSAEDILITVLYLQVESLRKRCEEQLGYFVTPDSVLSAWKIADTYSECKILKQDCVQYALDHFQKIIQSTDFVEIDFKNLIYLLSHDNLKVSDEDTVLLAVSKWVRHDRASRTSILKKILPHVRMPLVSVVEIDQLKEEFPEVMKKPVLPYVQEAELYKRDIARQMTISSSRTEYRQYQKKEKVLLIISGTESSMYSEFIRKMWCYSYYTNTWSKLASVPEKPEYGFATCTFGESDLYLTIGEGGSMLLNYSGLTNKWKECPCAENGRADHNMVAAQSSIYLIGGYEYIQVSGSLERQLCKKIDAYNVSEKLWQQVGDLHTLIHDCTSVVGPNDKIYIFGGYSDLDNQRSNIVQCFDTNTSTCTVITTDPGIKWVLGATSCNSNIFVANGENIYNFITENNEFRNIGKRTNVLIGMGMAQKESKIIFVGGEGQDQETVQDYLEEKDVHIYSASWNVVQQDIIKGTESVWNTPLPRCLTGINCHYFIVDKSILNK